MGIVLRTCALWIFFILEVSSNMFPSAALRYQKPSEFFVHAPLIVQDRTPEEPPRFENSMLRKSSEKRAPLIVIITRSKNTLKTLPKIYDDELLVGEYDLSGRYDHHGGRVERSGVFSFDDLVL